MTTKISASLVTMLFAAIFTLESHAEIVARYHAGLCDGPPPVAPDQYQFNGRSWTAALDTSIDMTVGPVSGDMVLGAISPHHTNCVNAWNVSDNSTVSGSANYSYPLDARYFIQSSGDLTSWITEQTRIPAVSSSTTHVLPDAAATSKKFFRVGVDTSP